MGKDFFIKIDSLSDTKLLYEELCVVTKENKNDARRIILGFKGTEKEVQARAITLDDIVTFCKAKRFTFSFQVNYTDSVITEEEIEAEKGILPGGFGLQTDVSKKMEEQRKDIITDPGQQEEKIK